MKQWEIFTGSSKSVTSITRAGNLATVTTESDHLLSSGISVMMSGADQFEYNGIVLITVIASNKFTYTVVDAPATPATGTILSEFTTDGFDKSNAINTLLGYTDPNTEYYRILIKKFDENLWAGIVDTVLIHACAAMTPTQRAVYYDDSDLKDGQYLNDNNSRPWRCCISTARLLA